MRKIKNLLFLFFLAMTLALPGCGVVTSLTDPENAIVKEETPNPTPAISVSEIEARVIELVNIERAKEGLSPLQNDTALSDVARLKSQDMYDLGYFAHNSPTYGSPFDMMKKFGISYSRAGENIAKGYTTPEGVVNGWMNSPGHRENILNDYTYIGIGYIQAENIWTQMFIKK